MNTIKHQKEAGRSWPILQRVAQKKQTITYKNLAARIGLSHHRPLRYTLSEIQDFCLDEDLPPLTILVVRQDGKPGSGFIAWPISDFEDGKQKVWEYDWAAVINPFPLKISVSEDLTEIENEEEYFEGRRRSRSFTNYFERNPRLRSAAILRHGTSCEICGFDFEVAYGARGAGYIEVHHLKPVSSLDDELTRVNPETDMAVVCSNCHRMIHRKTNKILSIEEMRELI